MYLRCQTLHDTTRCEALPSIHITTRCDEDWTFENGTEQGNAFAQAIYAHESIEQKERT